MSDNADQLLSANPKARVITAEPTSDTAFAAESQGDDQATGDAWLTDPYNTDLYLYAVIDAGTVFGLPEVLANASLDHCCLYDNPDTFDTAPWLVRLARDNRLQPWSLKACEAPGPLGAFDPSFVLFSAAPLDQMRSHLRKFTQQQVAREDRRLLVRFWEPDAAQFYFDAVSRDPEKSAMWFGSIIESIGAVHDGVAKLWHKPDASPAIAPQGPPRLTAAEMDSFRQYRKARFKRDMIKLFQQKSSDIAKAMGDETLADLVSVGIEGARNNGFTRTSPTQLFIHMCLALGAEFATDPQLHWVQSILQETSRDAWDQKTRADRLRQGLIAYLERVNGRKGAHLAKFIDALGAALPTLAPDVTAPETRVFLTTNFRTRTQDIGDKTLNWLIEDTFSGCHRHGFEEGRSAFILTMLRFVYGTECMRDPRFDWLRRCLFEAPKSGTKDAVLQTMFKTFLARSTALTAKAS